MSADNQQEYWNRVAGSKTFTHPLDIGMLNAAVSKDALVIDYGCGYGRLVKELNEHGFTHVKGFDTSLELIKRGHAMQVFPVFHFNELNDLPMTDASVDCFLLFAVLTCIPSNAAQQQLISFLHSKLKPGGMIYLSDYYLQANSNELERYEYLNGDQYNYGVFELPEGAMFRHHTREWIRQLFGNFTIDNEIELVVKTMNNNSATAFQMIVKKVDAAI